MPTRRLPIVLLVLVALLGSLLLPDSAGAETEAERERQRVREEQAAAASNVNALEADKDEVLGALADLRSVGVDIVTVGQYLRPTTNHLPVARWVTPDEFDDLRRAAEAMGFAHVESGPLTRSSYHARQAAEGAAVGLRTSSG